ncbi:DUF2183 domain-containing protein [Kiritimatiellaeota bacterium B1221]|nr:DUF2183 domain-containing protein [Kiritimatiellaeota bacterium B1221]
MMTHPLILNIELAASKTRAWIRRTFRRNHPVFIYPYRGYGHAGKVVLMGRVLEKITSIHETAEERDGKWHNFKKAWRRYFSYEVPGVTLQARFADQTAQTISDEEGYFEFEFTGDFAALGYGWKPVELEIISVPHNLPFQKSSTGEVILINDRSRFGIISDMDDTVMKSNVVKKFKMLGTMLFNSAETRVAFDGVDTLYQKLNHQDQNPLFFISGSSYNLYDLLEKFCKANQIPRAPMLLRDMGISKTQLFLERSFPFKTGCIEKLLTLFPDLPFILIGDSGQHDPEVYLHIQQKFPDRILGIYIRNVTLLGTRNDELTELQNKHPDFIAIKESQQAIDHAREKGWI